MMCLHSQHVHMSLPNSVATEEGNWVPGGRGEGLGEGLNFFCPTRHDPFLFFFTTILKLAIFLSREFAFDLP